MNILERILLESIIPNEANYTDLVLSRDIKKKVALTQDEILKHEVTVLENGSIEWKNETEDFAIEFSDLEKGLIKKTLEKLNSENKLNFQLISLYEMFK